MFNEPVPGLTTTIMKFPLFVFCAALCLMLLCPAAGRAGMHITGRCNGCTGPGGMVTDTVPGNKQVPDNPDAQKKEELIKEVPKAKKQEKPIAVLPVTIKPVVVKPKVIIKPIIKIH